MKSYEAVTVRVTFEPEGGTETVETAVHSVVELVVDVVMAGDVTTAGRADPFTMSKNCIADARSVYVGVTGSPPRIVGAAISAQYTSDKASDGALMQIKPRSSHRHCR